MSKTIRISLLAAACGLATAALQVGGDAPGVTVSLNGAAVMHRGVIDYPQEALRRGVQGAVVVQVKLDSAGEVSDAQVLSGPDELRKAVLESVLQWHFMRDAAGTTRTVQVAFELPKQSASPGEDTVSSYLRTIRMEGGPTGPIKSIRVVGLSDQATAEVLAALPVHEGDEWNAETMQKANQAVKAFDEHLTVQQSGMVQRPSGVTEILLRIAATGQPGAPAMAGRTPERIKVGGNVQGAMIVTKVPPVYPPLAKQAGVQGVVQLLAVLAKDGTVREVHTLSGPPLLIQAAIDAVRQWVYKPTLLNGAPTEVETTIDINFTLAQ
jgi:TonB family protein